MQVTVETVSKLERKMRITVPASEVSEKVEVKIKQAAGRGSARLWLQEECRQGHAQSDGENGHLDAAIV